MIIRRTCFFVVSLIFTVALVASENDNLIVLQKDGKVLAKYRCNSVPFKPYVAELLTPSGKNILRDAPRDHVHHHALMFAIRIGECNFWEEYNLSLGKQITTSYQHVGNETVSQIDWNSSEPTTLVKEFRRITVNTGTNVTTLDWNSTFVAVNDTTLGYKGSGHYHGLGMRFVQEMDKDGRFYNDTGKHDGEIVRGDERLTRCRWMAYTAKLDGKPVTVAMFDAPSNPVPMTAFTMGDASDAFAYMSATMNWYREPVELRTNQIFVIHYRIAVWDGEVSHETVEEMYQEFVQPPIDLFGISHLVISADRR